MPVAVRQAAVLAQHRASPASTRASRRRSLGHGTLGYEWDDDADNGFRPPGLFDLSSTTVTSAVEVFTDYGSTSRHRHRHPPPDALPRPERRAGLRRRHGAVVLGPRRPRTRAATPDTQHAAGDGQPVRRHGRAAGDAAVAGLIAATDVDRHDRADLDDHVARRPARPSPTASRSRSAAPPPTPAAAWSPASRSRPTAAPPGTRPTGTHAPGPTRGRRTATRVDDDQGRAPSTTAATSRRPSPGHRSTSSCPCSLWGTGRTPGHRRLRRATRAVEVGIKFTSDISGNVTGVRFYKAAANTGTHIGNLWTATGTLLAPATFTGETASGWQQVTFASPVAITPDTTYVASYYAPNGHYSATTSYFYREPVAEPDRPAASTVRRCTRCATRHGAATAVYRTQHRAPSRPAPATRANYWVDVDVHPGSGPATAPGAPHERDRDTPGTRRRPCHLDRARQQRQPDHRRTRSRRSSGRPRSTDHR